MDPTLTSTSGRKPRRPRWHYVLGALITLGSLGIMGKLVYDNLDPLLRVREQIRLWPLLATVPIFLIGEGLASLAWGAMMNNLAPRLPLRDHFRIFVVTHAARRLPGTLWYVIGRVAWYERLGVAKRVTTFGSLLETVLIIWAGLVMALLTIPLTAGLSSNLVGLFLAGVVLSGTLLHPRLLRYVLGKLGVEVEEQQLRYRAILGWLGLYLALWLVGGSMLYLVLLALGPLPPGLWAASVGAWSVAGVAGLLIQILPSGLGLSEATISLMLAPYMPASIAVAGALVLRLVMTALEFGVASAVYWLSSRLEGTATGAGNERPLD